MTHFDQRTAVAELRAGQAAERAANPTRLAPGWYFGTLCRSIAVARGDWLHCAAYAEGMGWSDVARVAKAAVDPINSTSLPAAMKPFNEDLAALLRPLTLIGRLGLRRVPLATRLLRQSVGGDASFVAEGDPVAATAAGYDDAVELARLKVGGISVFSGEVMRSMSRGASALIAADIASSIAEALDRAFIDPSFSGVPNVAPASITSTGTRLQSSGTTLAAIDADIKALIAALVAAGMPLTTATLVMSPITATNLSLLRGTGGAPAYPNITARAGSIAGLPVLTSAALSSAGSPGERQIALVEAAEVMLGDDSEALVDVSTNATMQMSDTPVDGAAQGVSLWQSNLIGVKTTRFCNWLPRRDGAVAVMENVLY